MTLKEKNDLYGDITTHSKEIFQFFIGSRGRGKSYPVLRSFIPGNGFTPDLNGRFLYVRRMAREAQASALSESNPFKKLNDDLGRNIYASYDSAVGVGTFRERKEIGEGAVDDLIGYITSVSSFAGGLRSVDLSDVSVILYEEFIPEKHVRKIKGEGEAFLNLYETVNRNREIEGKDPVKVYFLANAISLSNPTLAVFGIISDIQGMIRNGESRRTDRERSIYIELMSESEISEKKKKTALYKALGTENDFSKNALAADFHDERLGMICRENTREYVPFISWGSICIYAHKSNGCYYAAKTGERARVHFKENEIPRFRGYYRARYIYDFCRDAFLFDDFVTKMAIESALAWSPEKC